MAEYNSDRTGANIDALLDNIDAIKDKITPTGTGAKVEGNLSFDDNDKILLGDSGDFEIYHEGADSIIRETGSGALSIRGTNVIISDSTDTKKYFVGIASTGESSLFYGGSQKFKTTATGVDVTGTVTADGLTVGSGATFNGGDTTIDFSLGTGRFTTPNSFVFTVDDDNNTTTQAIYFRADSGKELVTIKENGDVHFYEDTGTTAKFVWDASTESLAIGASSPSSALHVEKSIPSATSLDPTLLILKNKSDGGVAIDLTNGVAGNSRIASKVNSTGAGTDETSLVFSTSNSATLSERMRIDSSGNVGVGGVPTEKLDIDGNLTYPKIKINASSATARFMRIGMDSATEHSIEANGGSTNLLFKTVGTERLRIDSSGNLLVGKTSFNGNTTGFQVEPAGAIAVTRNGSTTAYFNRQTSDGEIVALRKDGTTVGSIGSYGNRPYFATDNTGIRIVGGDIRPTGANGIDSDATVDLGDSISRFKDLYLSGGVYLGGTGAANKLDDYETGTWTPVVEGSATAGSFSDVYTLAEYVKVGRKVTCTFAFNATSGTGVGELRLKGLPFAVTLSECAGVVFANTGLVFNSGFVPVWIKHDTSTFKIRAMNPSGGAYQAVPYSSALGYLRGTLTYFTDD